MLFQEYYYNRYRQLRKNVRSLLVENDIQTENERVRSRSLSSAESDGSGPSGIAALRSTIDHMGFDSKKVNSFFFSCLLLIFVFCSLFNLFHRLQVFFLILHHFHLKIN